MIFAMHLILIYYASALLYICDAFTLYLLCVHYPFYMHLKSIVYALQCIYNQLTMRFAMYNICLLYVQCPFPDALVECTSMHYNYKSIAVFNDSFGCALLMLMDTHDILLNVWVQYLFRNSYVHVKD